MKRFLPITALLPLLSACGFFQDQSIIIVSDHPEFAIYGEYFNSAQTMYKVEVRYSTVSADELRNPKSDADIVITSWAPNTETLALFRPLDSLLKGGNIELNIFYQSLLALGQSDGRQYLLPVSFNLPMLLFSSKTRALLSNPFTIDFEETKKLGMDFNVKNGSYTRMGFSPSWNDEYLLVTAILFGASFREGQPLSWEEDALEAAIDYVRTWTDDANGGVQAEDEFSFKYLYDPPVKLLSASRILFAYTRSNDFFTLPAERREELDFRWIAEGERIPVAQDAVFYGICKNGKTRRGAEAFTRWFFNEDTQRLLIESAKSTRLSETLFGISNGFSAMKTVTEHVFPRFYPGLLGHLPPEDLLLPPQTLPRDWISIRDRVLYPYLRERIGSEDWGGGGNLLDARITAWLRAR